MICLCFLENLGKFGNIWCHSFISYVIILVVVAVEFAFIASLLLVSSFSALCKNVSVYCIYFTSCFIL